MAVQPAAVQLQLVAERADEGARLAGGVPVLGRRRMEWRRGKEGGWFLIDNSCSKDVEDEAFDIEVAVGLIAATKQAEGVEIVEPDRTC